MIIKHDRKMTPAEIADITGVPATRPRAQYNALSKAGIKAFINARRQVVTFTSWVALAGVNQVVIHTNGAGVDAPANDELELDFSGLDKMVS
jgi:hypothetical protein